MKNYYNYPKWLFLAAILFSLELSSCTPKEKFDVELTEKVHSLTESAVMPVKTYTLVYSAKGNANIKFIVSSGSKYSIPSLSAAQLAALLAVLDRPTVSYDTVNREFHAADTVKGGRQ